MYDLKQATDIVQQALPDDHIIAAVQYKELYIFQVFNDRPEEEEMDPFYSVDSLTGEFRDFSIITDGNPKEIMELFIQVKNNQP
jgi:hypothetical protein